MRTLTLLVLLTGLVASDASAQHADLRVPPEDSIQVLVLIDGTRHVGRVQAAGADTVVFATTSAVIRIPVANVRSVTLAPASRLRNGEYWPSSPSASRLFFAPTARMQPAGSGYFATHWFFFPSVNYGVSKNVTLGGGGSIIPGAGADQVFYLTPKVGLSAAEKTHVAAGALVAGFSGEVLGIVYGLGTFGGEDGAVTLGAGWGFADGSLADRPAVMLGADRRISRRASFITENWWLGGDTEPLVSYGVRFLGERMSIDLGFMHIVGDDFFFPGIPLIGFAIGF